MRSQTYCSAGLATRLSLWSNIICAPAREFKLFDAPCHSLVSPIYPIPPPTSSSSTAKKIKKKPLTPSPVSENKSLSSVQVHCHWFFSFCPRVFPGVDLIQSQAFANMILNGREANGGVCVHVTQTRIQFIFISVQLSVGSFS